MVWSAPSSRAFASLRSSPAVVMTIAPSILQIWMAAVPTPEPPPITSTDLPRPKFGVTHQHVPRGQEHQRHRSGLHKTQRVGNRKDTGARDSNQLAVPSFGIVAEHGELRTEILPSAVALLAVAAIQHRREQDACTRLHVGDVLATLRDFSGDITAKDVRQLHTRQSFAHPEIKMVQRAGANANEDMIFAQFGIGCVFVLKDFGTAKFVNANGFHRAAPEPRTDAF